MPSSASSGSSGSDRRAAPKLCKTAGFARIFSESWVQNWTSSWEDPEAWLWLQKGLALLQKAWVCFRKAWICCRKAWICFRKAWDCFRKAWFLLAEPLPKHLCPPKTVFGRNLDLIGPFELFPAGFSTEFQRASFVFSCPGADFWTPGRNLRPRGRHFGPGTFGPILGSRKR